jgi:hypothetical protein
LSVNASAALVGAQGLRAVLDDSRTIHVTDNRPDAETGYWARFHFDPNSIRMASGDNHVLLYGYTGTSTLALRLQLRFSGGGYELRASLQTDGGTWINSPWSPLSDSPHIIELAWRASTASGANNGGLTLWIDGLQRGNITGANNDTRRIDRVRLGAVAGIDTGTRGTYYFDGFESRRIPIPGP